MDNHVVGPINIGIGVVPKARVLVSGNRPSGARRSGVRVRHGFRPRIRNAKLEILAEPAIQSGLQRVVVRGANILPSFKTGVSGSWPEEVVALGGLLHDRPVQKSLTRLRGVEVLS